MERGGSFNYFNPAVKAERGQEDILPPDLARKETDNSINNLDKVLVGGLGDKIVPFSGKVAVIKKEEPESQAETESFGLAELSEMWRKYLNLKIDKKEKDQIFQKINKARPEIIRETGAKEVFFGFDGDISLIYADGRTEKIFNNPGLPVISGTEADQREILSNNFEVIGGEMKEKKFQAEDFNISEPLVDVEAARFFAKNSDYLNLSAVPFCSKEVLRALRPKAGMINFLGLESGKIDNEMREILKSFAGKILLKDDLRRRIDEGK